MGPSCVYAPLRAYSPPATGQGDDPTPSGPRRPSRPGSTPPSLPSELPFSTATGRSIRPTPSEGSRASGVHTPFGTPPSSNLGDSLLPRDGRESALPSLRMVERFPHTDRHELPSSPVDLRVWRSLAPRPLRPGHGPSIAYTPLPVTPAPDRESIPGAESRGGVLPPLPRGERAGVRVIPSPASGAATTNQRPSQCHSDAPRGILDLPTRHSPCPFPHPQYRTRGRGWHFCANLCLCSSFPLSLKGPKGEGDQGGEGSPWGWGPPATREIPRNPFRRRSIKPATSSINVQSKPQPHNRIETRCVANPPHGYLALNTPTLRAKLPTRRGVAQSGSAPAWGAGGRWFKSSRPDHSHPSYHRPGLVFLLPPVASRQMKSSLSAIIAPNLHLAGG